MMSRDWRVFIKLEKIKLKNKILSIVVFASFLSVLAGCSPVAGNSITKAEISRLVSLPKIEGTEIDGTLKYLSAFPGTPVHLTGKVVEVQHPLSSTMADGVNFEWVPIIVEVETSNDTEANSRVMLRLYPVADSNDSLMRLKAGDEIIALTAKRVLDDNNLQGFTIGSLYHVVADETIVQYDSGATFEGSLMEFRKILDLN